MKKPSVDDIRLMVVRMITAEQDDHARLLREIKSRALADEEYVIEQLRAVHQARIDSLQSVLDGIVDFDRRK